MTSTFSRFAVLPALFAVFAQGAFAAEKKPNIVFILADDLGYTDISAYGSKYYETPNIDRLAAEGVKFTHGYTAGPNCQPTRAALISGQYGPRTGVYTVGNIDRFDWRSQKLRPVDNLAALPPEKTTIAQSLKKAGYATGLFGKWHLGEAPGQHPSARGFDEAIVSAGKHFDFRTSPKTDYPEGTYLADFLTDKAVDFIERHKDGPFFLYVPHYGVHSPLQAKDALIAKFRDKPAAGGHKDPVYAAMIASVDESVGRIAAKLDELGLAENTLIVFTSDNGGVGGYRREGIEAKDTTDNAPLRGGKGTLHEGGIRVPYVFRWKGTIPAGSVSETPVISVDLHPSLLELSGAPAPENQPLDGVSYVSVLKDPATKLDRDALFWHFPGYLGSANNTWRTKPVSVIRQGPWKLIENLEDKSLQLYDLSADIGEKNDLASSQPEKAASLLARLNDWRESVGAKASARSSPRKTNPPRRRPERRAKRTTGKPRPMTSDTLSRGWRFLFSLLLALPAHAAEKPCCTPTGRAALFSVSTAAEKKESKPNVIYLLADDLGGNDVGWRNPEFKTPHLDKLAASGAKLDQYYVQPVCSPTRAAFLTGRYPFRYGFQTGVVRPWAQYGLPLEERILPQALKETGYETAIAGKWHLGHFQPEYLPTRRGFDHQYGHYNGALDYFTHVRDGGFDWHRDDKVNRDEGYSTELIGKEAARRIRDRDKSKPLFLYVPFNGVHSPFQVPEKYLALYPKLEGNRKIYAGMISALDDAVGEIAKAIDDEKIGADTLVIFSSDNGGPNPGKLSDNGKLRAGKGTVYEGGVRVAAFAAWPGKIAAGSTIATPIHITDWYPTLLRITGATTDQKLPVDGTDISAALKGETIPDREIVINVSPETGALRSGDWKLVVKPAKPELYNLAEDVAEKNDLAASHSEKVTELKARYDALAKEAVPPKTRPRPRDFKSPAVWGE